MICPGCQRDSASGIRCNCGKLWCPVCHRGHACTVPDAWAHQTRGVEGAFAAEAEGWKAICIASPTGMGKRRLMTDMIRRSDGMKCGIFTNRKFITSQTITEINTLGVEYGVLAAGHEYTGVQDVLVARVQTAGRRGGADSLPLLDRVWVDECHNHVFDWVVAEYLRRGSTVFGLTATPIGLKHYQHLVIAGNNSEGRQCGALVPCYPYAPELPDLRGWWKNLKPEGDEENAKGVVSMPIFGPNMEIVGRETEVFGNVFPEWKRLNPDARPTLIWAPKVDASRWLVQQFIARGVAAEHIDGGTPDQQRDDIAAAHKEGRIKVVSSCGVLREGVDWPWVYHGIGLQAWEGLITFLQCCGRLLRAYPGKDSCILEDHAGSIFRHGSPNEDRVWALGKTEKQYENERYQGYKNNERPEPIRCPKCGMLRRLGPVCPGCKHQHTKSVWMIRMGDGKLTRKVGDICKKRKPMTDQRVWMSALYACAKSGRTLSNARGIFYQRTGRWPQASELKYVPPQNHEDWHRLAEKVYPFLAKGKAKT